MYSTVYSQTRVARIKQEVKEWLFSTQEKAFSAQCLMVISYKQKLQF